MKTRLTRRGERGFTLIELLVVVLVIGILAAIAIPQYFKVVERGRLSEAHTMISQIKQAQERYLARNGVYVGSQGDLTTLDIIFGGTSPSFGMRNYTATAIGQNCAAGGPGYFVNVSRIAANSGIASRYGTGYTVGYDSCNGLLNYGTCANCIVDFAQ